MADEKNETRAAEDQRKRDAEAASKATAKADKDAAAAREDRLSAERERSDADTAAQYARQEGVQPTPTQEENDRAKLGEDVADKEHDGSESEEDRAKRLASEGRAMPMSGAGGTENRSVDTGKK